MRAYRDRYDQFTAAGAQILAVSTDRPGIQGSFKSVTKAPFPFVADRERRLVDAFGVKGGLFNVAQRYTFVIATDGRISEVFEGRAALDPSTALAACGAAG
jgi:peroxiredoxin